MQKLKLHMQKRRTKSNTSKADPPPRRCGLISKGKYESKIHNRVSGQLRDTPNTFYKARDYRKYS